MNCGMRSADCRVEAAGKFHRRNDRTFYSGAALEELIVGTTKRLAAVLCRGVIYYAHILKRREGEKYV